MYTEEILGFLEPADGAPPFVDFVSGLTLNAPLGWQGPHHWWKHFPEVKERLLAARAAMNLPMIDDHFDEPLPATVRDMANVVSGIEVTATKSAFHRPPRIPRGRNGGPLETKVVRRVRSAAGMAKYGLPMGAIIVADAPKFPAKRNGKRAPAKERAKTTARATRKRPETPTGKNAKGPTALRAGRLHLDVAANTTNDGRLRAWGPEDDGQMARRANVASRDYKIAYMKPAELEDLRKVAIKRAKKTPRPQKWDIADNKRIIKEGGPGGKDDSGKGLNDNLRGNNVQRSVNSWAVYVAFGGVDSKGKDKGYVGCVGCGLKMAWHDDENFSEFPKFEQDKIITGADGGQYNPQNIVPMCAGCNNQRGDKNMWLSPAFKNAKPSWYGAEFRVQVEKTRPKPRKDPNKKGGEGRPAKEIPVWEMPIPPGNGKPLANGRRRVESYYKSFTADRARRIAPVAELRTGDRVSARLYNWDGRREPIVSIPDVRDPSATLIGKLIVEEVDSAFGTYTRHLLITDGGLFRLVEEDSITVISDAVRIAEEEKAIVRTPEGALKYGVPIGSVIGKRASKITKSPKLKVEKAPDKPKKLKVTVLTSLSPKKPKAESPALKAQREELESSLNLARSKFGTGSNVKVSVKANRKPRSQHLPEDWPEPGVIPPFKRAPYERKPKPDWMSQQQYDRDGDTGAMRHNATQDRRERNYYQRNQPPVDSGPYEGVTHFDMLNEYADIAHDFSVETKKYGRMAYAVNAYTEDEYVDMNGLLRDENYGDDHLSEQELRVVRKMVKDMDAAIKVAGGAPFDMVTHRTTNAAHWPVMKVGQVFEDKGYTSTTLSQGYLDEVAKELYKPGQHTMVKIQIRVPKGTPGIYATAFQDRRDIVDTGEQEFVLKHGTKYKVIDTYEENGVIEQILEVVA